jgi:glyoxylase-like metal-dependent hydrolase (beta-lactamase superfamily II)
VKKQLVAPDVWRLPLMPLDAVNVYVVGDVLIDSGGRMRRRRLLTALEEHGLTAHALTHAHVDHQGASHAVCEAFAVPLWCGAGDRQAVESGDLARVLPDPSAWIARLSNRLAGPAHPVSRVLTEGDRIGDLTVVEAPGHTPGHLAFWREHDGVLIIGDVLFHKNPATLRAGLSEPFGFATIDPATNRASARKLAALKPRIVCFGHGEPLADGERFQRFVASLPAD